MLQKILLSTSFVFVLCATMNAQPFEFEYDPNTNTITLEFTGCDACIYQNADDVEGCLCARECKGEEGWLSCRDYCSTLYDEQEESICLDACEAEFADYLNCIRGCDRPFIGLSPCKPCGVRYRFIADYASIPLDPRVQAGNVTVSIFYEEGGYNNNWNETQCEYDNGEWINHCEPWDDLQSFTLPSWWSTVTVGKNTCYGLQFQLSYIECPYDLETGQSGQCNQFNCIVEQTIWICDFVG